MAWVYVKMTELIEKSSVTITIGDRAENHVGMQILGRSAARGYTLEDLEAARARFAPATTELVELHAQHPNLPPAYVLVVRGAIANHVEIFDEMRSLEWDKKIYSRLHKTVVNKLARFNLCFAQAAQEPNYPEKRGTVVALDQVPLLNGAKASIMAAMGDPEEAVVEGNLYEDVTVNGIGFHGDGERKKTVGLRLGASHDIVFQWFAKDTVEIRKRPRLASVGEPIRITLNAGDVYAMTEKATGTDWKRRAVATVRHAAGAKQYVTASGKHKKRSFAELFP